MILVCHTSDSQITLNSLHGGPAGYFFMLLLSSNDFFQSTHVNLFEKFFRKHYQCQMVWHATFHLGNHCLLKYAL